MQKKTTATIITTRARSTAPRHKTVLWQVKPRLLKSVLGQELAPPPNATTGASNTAAVSHLSRAVIEVNKFTSPDHCDAA
jgi:UDP-3-O-[3-hydroxymyristoyl] glucosamine N-acyltransferase